MKILCLLILTIISFVFCGCDAATKKGTTRKHYHDPALPAQELQIAVEPDAVIDNGSYVNTSESEPVDMRYYQSRCRTLEAENSELREENDYLNEEKKSALNRLEVLENQKNFLENELIKIEKKIAEDRLEDEKRHTGIYEVREGDSLWVISGKEEIYNNPYKWIEIFYANKDKIEDPNLIYPGMVLKIPRYKELMAENGDSGIEGENNGI